MKSHVLHFYYSICWWGGEVINSKPRIEGLDEHYITHSEILIKAILSYLTQEVRQFTPVAHEPSSKAFFHIHYNSQMRYAPSDNYPRAIKIPCNLAHTNI